MLEMKAQASNLWEILLKTSTAMVVLPIPCPPHITTVRTSFDFKSSSKFTFFIRDSIPTNKSLLVPHANANLFKFFDIYLTISWMKSDSCLQKQKVQIFCCQPQVVIIKHKTTLINEFALQFSLHEKGNSCNAIAIFKLSHCWRKWLSH